MPELTHTFAGGKMNKDLDERLIPNGEYRDALNLEISSSEGSDKGAMQNIKGNIAINNKSYNPSTLKFNTWQANEYIPALTNATCIGSVEDTFNDNIYWLIASDEASVVARFNQSENIVEPILVDTEGILEFSKNKLITGINIFENVLFWTDNNKEPKSLNIVLFQNSTTSFLKHSRIYNRDFIESDVTVIKKSPLTAPTINAATSIRGGQGTGINPVSVRYTVANRENFTYNPDAAIPAEYVAMPTYAQAQANPSEFPPGINGIVSITTSGTPNWRNNDTINLIGKYVSQYQEAYSYQVVLLVTNGGGTSNLQCQIQSISSDILRFTTSTGASDPIVWDALLNEGDSMFETSFPRFAYRWKYANNQYSCFSPFSEVAFLGGKFEYLSSDGYNTGMQNNIRFLKIESINWGDENVEEIEVLYKDSISQAIYLVDTIENRSTNYLEIKSEIIGAIVESNQILRPWDNVPVKALSQEITGNRLLYGNYTQNYQVDRSVSLSVNEAPVTNTNIGFPVKSLKSIRKYQSGIVYKDAYGRETPVFTNATAVIDISKVSSVFKNQLEIQSNDQAPIWATHFKYFIKETSNEYYNLALDRYYLAEDGNVWLSFPSSERNKVDEETFLQLKKQHGSNVSVTEPAKFKVLSISNEAPNFIATTTLGIAESPCTLLAANQPKVDVISFQFEGPLPEDNTQFSSGIVATNVLVIAAGGSSTNEYTIASGGPTGTNDVYNVTLQEPLGSDAFFLDSLVSGDEITITLKEIAVEQLPEFEGRFFAKINRNATFDTNIIDSFNGAEARYGVVSQLDVPATIAVGIGPKSGSGPTSSGPGFRDDNARWKNQEFLSPPVTNQDWVGVGWSTSSAGNESPLPSATDKDFPTTPLLDEYMNQRGTLLRFINSNGKESEIYTVTDVKETWARRGRDGYTGSQRQIAANAVKLVRSTLDRPFESSFGTTVKVQALQKIASPGNKVLSSTNPAIFETEPKEAVDIDIYYQATNAIPISEHGNPILLDWFNCYSYGQGVESNRIRDDYNQPYIDKGPIVSAPLDEPYSSETRATGLIFSQIFNSNSGINGLNQFIQALPITKDLNPVYGSIQKLHSRDTNLVALCEDKILKVLANKDALYNADGSANVTSNNNVLGQAIPYAGEFGISKNPESFASYGYRVYFTDKGRGVALRLSNDGLEEISRYGMEDFFSDNLIANGNIFGSYDVGTGEYNVTLNTLTPEWQEKLATSEFERTNETDPSCIPGTRANPAVSTTISFAEGNNGWASRKSFILENGASLNNKYYTFRNGLIWEHKANSVYNNFYNVQYDSSVDVVTNDAPSLVKGFKTLNYVGSSSLEYEYQITGGNGANYSIAQIQAAQLTPISFSSKNGWYANSTFTDLQEGKVKEFITKEGKHFNYIKGLPTYFNTTCDTNVNTQEFSVQGIGRPSALGGATEITAWDIHISVDASCYNTIQPPVVGNQFYKGIEDTVMNVQLAGPTACANGGTVVYSLASDATTGGVLNSISSTGLFQFTPNLNYFGGAGTFNVNACCGEVCSVFTVTLEIEAVAENPYFVSTPPALSLQPGDCWGYDTIILADPDHASTSLTIQTPVPDLPAWMAQPLPLNDGTGNWYIPNSCLPQGQAASAITFTMTVEDPDGNTGTQNVGGNTLIEAVVALEFLITSRPVQYTRTYVSPSGVSTVLKGTAESEHGCNRGTYTITGNGVTIGRAYVGNVRGIGGLVDSFNQGDGLPFSPTGDLMQNIPDGTVNNIPSAVSQGTTDTRLFNPVDDTWAGWPNSGGVFVPQKYILPTDNFNGVYASASRVYARYNLLSIDSATAQSIITNSPDPDNPSYITFALVADTFIKGTRTINIHGDSVGMQIFQSEIEVYSALQANNSALTIDVLTGNIVP
jgi:hypothetical protein